VVTGKVKEGVVGAAYSDGTRDATRGPPEGATMAVLRKGILSERAIAVVRARERGAISSLFSFWDKMCSRRDERRETRDERRREVCFG
jgi:hypothetical protein